MLQGAATHRLDVGQHAHRHDRVLQDDAGQFAGVDAVEVVAHFVESALGDAQHGQTIVVEEQDPAFDVGQRVVDHVFIVLEYAAVSPSA
ncbi:hypothetical protein AT959_13115 [Dechloromonas denitrificans]|uniref:Uncharacterized protein n=1 Tax=Dechloromonas denitrificans TaxID=281362 RepID=A0A133XH63_9RHOO|nr:hypothetical protein AT959_13115 [Dechloromonas denitrificans]